MLFISANPGGGKDIVYDGNASTPILQYKIELVWDLPRLLFIKMNITHGNHCSFKIESSPREPCLNFHYAGLPQVNDNLSNPDCHKGSTK